MKAAALKINIILYLLGTFTVFAVLMTAPVLAVAQETSTPTVQNTPDGSSKESPLLNPCTNQPFTTVLDNSGLHKVNAQVGGTSNTEWVIAFTLADNDQAHKLTTFTASHIQQPLAIVIDGQVLSVPVIQAPLTDGGQITGGFTETNAKILASQLRYTPLPVTLHVTSIQKDSQDPTVSHIVLNVDGAAVSTDTLTQTKHIIENRLADAVNVFATHYLGIFSQVGQYTVGINSDNAITVDLKNVRDPSKFVPVISQTGLLELVDFSNDNTTCSAPFPQISQYILTDLQVKRASQQSH